MADNPLSPSLTWAMSRVLPGREETWLLRAILHQGNSAKEAWRAFTSSINDVPSLFRTDTGGRKRLGPLLMASIRKNDLPADPTLLTVLRTAYLREELRVDAFRTIAEECYKTLDEAEVPFAVLKGAALGETVYKEACFRHAHDLDLLVEEGDLPRAQEALREVGLENPDPLPGGRGVTLAHRTQTPINLQTRLYRDRFYWTRFSAVWDRSEPRELPSGRVVKVLSQGDNLVHTLAHAAYCPGRSTLQWVTDAWMILHGQHPLDWNSIPDIVRESRTEIPFFVLLRYLSEELGSPVPDSALDILGIRASEAGNLRRDVALYGARQSRGHHRQLGRLQRPGLGDRLDLFLWQVFPSREYLSWAYDDPHPTLVPGIYLLRPISYLAERAKWKMVGLVKGWAGRSQ